MGIFQAEFGIDGTLGFVNPFGAEVFGYDCPDDMVGLKVAGFFVCGKDFGRLLDRLKADGVVDNFEFKCRRRDCGERVVSVSAVIVEGGDGAAVRIDGVVRDVQFRVDEVLDADIISSVNEILISNLDIREVYQRVCAQLHRRIEWERVSVTLREKDEGLGVINFLVTKSVEDSAVSRKLGLRCGYPFQGSILETVVLSGRPVITADTSKGVHETDKLFAEDGLMSRLAYPLRSSNRIIGSVNFSCKRLNYYNEEHVKLLDKVVPSLGVAIENTKLYVKAAKSEKEYKELFRTVDSAWL